MTDPARDPLNPGRLPSSGFEIWNGLGFSASVLALSRAVGDFGHPLVVITENTEAADQWIAEWSFFAAHLDLPVLRLPDWETLPFDVFSPHEDIVSERLRTLYRLPSLRSGLVVLPVSTLMQRLPPRQWLQSECLVLRIGQSADRIELREALAGAGYQSVHQVLGHGEFSMRGEILDIYPMGADRPVRVEFLDDEIDSLRYFDAESQRSTDRIEQLEILPGHEFPLNPDSIKAFRGRYRARFAGDPSRHTVYRDVSEGLAPAGVESYLPLFFDGLETLFEYCPDARVVQFGDIAGAAERFASEILSRFEQLRHQVDRPLLPPSDL